MKEAETRAGGTQQAGAKPGVLVVDIDLHALMTCVLRTFDVFQSRSNQERAVPLSPQEMDNVLTIIDYLQAVMKGAYRMCWDGKAYCRFNRVDGVCEMDVEALAKEPWRVVDCKQRGADISTTKG